MIGWMVVACYWGFSGTLCLLTLDRQGRNDAILRYILAVLCWLAAQGTVVKR